MVVAEGQGSELARGPVHLAARVAADVLGHDRFEVRVRSEIPVARGLGSSAALAVAAAAAAGAKRPLRLTASPSTATPRTPPPRPWGAWSRRPWSTGRPSLATCASTPRLRFVAVVPDRQLATSRARGTLPDTVPHEDAAFNLGRLGLLVAGLADHTPAPGHRR